MKSTLNKSDIEEFWLGLYFDLKDGFELAAIKRAYLDFSRTLEDFPKDEQQKLNLKTKWINLIKQELTVLLSSRFSSDEEFTLWHQSFCYKLRTTNTEYQLSQGQAQKWVNMTLKYLYSFGDKRVDGISNNYKYFHIPIDNIVLKSLAIAGIQNPFKTPWSKIQRYEDYYHYQKSVRNYYNTEIPMDVEFRLFNKA